MLTIYILYYIFLEHNQPFFYKFKYKYNHNNIMIVDFTMFQQILSIV